MRDIRILCFPLKLMFCWDRFSACRWLVWVLVFEPARFTTHLIFPIFPLPFTLPVNVIRCLHFQLIDRPQHEKSCKWQVDGTPICWSLCCFSNNYTVSLFMTRRVVIEVSASRANSPKLLAKVDVIVVVVGKIVSKIPLSLFLPSPLPTSHSSCDFLAINWNLIESRRLPPQDHHLISL